MNLIEMKNEEGHVVRCVASDVEKWTEQGYSRADSGTAPNAGGATTPNPDADGDGSDGGDATPDPAADDGAAGAAAAADDAATEGGDDAAGSEAG